MRFNNHQSDWDRKCDEGMLFQRLNWFFSIQSREVTSRLGRPLAQACFTALDRRRKIPRTAALGWRTRLILLVSYVNSVMGSILDAPALLFKIHLLFSFNWR